MQVFIKSFGCSTNLADGEVLAGCLAKAGYKLVNEPSDADVVVYNTCAVKGPTEDRMINLLKNSPQDKKLIVAGCLPLINPERLRKEVHYDGILDPAAGQMIVDTVKRVMDNENIISIGNTVNTKPSLKLPKVRLNPQVSIIPINYGCLGSCTYCCVVSARGQLRSYSIEEITERVQSDLASGIREFWLTSQDTACYGRDIGVTLADLLEVLCNIEEDFFIRVGMMTPILAKKILEDLVKTFQSNKVFKFIHLPVQSGDDIVLKRMQRFHSVEDFKEIVNAFRSSFPGITLATDVICGFPGETRKAFKQTLRLVEEVKPDIVNVSKFFARPGTVAAEMTEDFVSASEIKHRSTIMAKLVRRVSLERNLRWIGWTGEVFMNEIGKVPRSWIGRNFAYKPVVIKNCSKDLIGVTLRLRIVEAFTTYLEGKIIS